jgi:hypothetical protein
LLHESITNSNPCHMPSPSTSSGPTRFWWSLHCHRRRRPSSPSLYATRHHHGVGCCLVPPAATVILILVVQRCRNPTNDGINTASPPFSSPPPSQSRPLHPLDRPWRHLGPACGVDALRYDAASAAPARAPLFERRDNCASAAVKTAAMPRSPLRRLVLDLRFSGRRRQSGDGDGSTLTLTLIPGASGAATTTPDLPGNLCRLCSRSLSFCQQGFTGGAGIGHGRVAE